MTPKEIEKSNERSYNESSKEFNPKMDYLFKVLFGEDRTKARLKEFLEVLLKIKMNNLEVDKETYLRPELAGQRAGALDVRAELDNGTKVNLEMQIAHVKGLENRAMFYLSKLFLKNIPPQTLYENFPKAIVIFILDQTHLNEVKDYHTVWKMQNLENEISFDNVEIHFIELEKYRKLEHNMDNKLEQWLTFIDYQDKEMIQMAIEKNELIKDAQDEIEQLTEAQKAYLKEIEEKMERDRLSEISYWKDVAREEGMEKGTTKEKNEIAKRMLKEGFEIELIVKITGLSKDEIERLK